MKFKIDDECGWLSIERGGGELREWRIEFAEVREIVAFARENAARLGLDRPDGFDIIATPLPVIQRLAALEAELASLREQLRAAHARQIAETRERIAWLESVLRNLDSVGGLQ